MKEYSPYRKKYYTFMFLNLCNINEISNRNKMFKYIVYNVTRANYAFPLVVFCLVC